MRLRSGIRTILFVTLMILMAATLARQSFSAGQIVIDTMTVAGLKNNRLGDPDIRDIAIYLPPSYDSSDKVYPVIYLLHGFGGDEQSLMDEVGEDIMIFLIDGMIDAGSLKEMIIVMPDGKNKYGGSFYLNSELIGNYEDYMAVELVEHIDSSYRTIPNSEGRAIAGVSMGGYGSMTLAMKHPETYSAVVSLSPPLGFEVISDELIPEVLRENPEVMGGPNTNQYTDYMYALSAALSPNLDNPPFFVDLPFEYPSGQVIEAVRQRWLKADPLTMLFDHGPALAGMKGIYIDVGSEDLPGFKMAGDAFHQELVDMGIQHVYDVYEGDHYANPIGRAINLLIFLSDLFPSASSTVEYRNQLLTTWGIIK